MQSRYAKVAYGGSAYFLLPELYVLASVTENGTISTPMVLLLDVGRGAGTAAKLVAFTAVQQSARWIRYAAATASISSFHFGSNSWQQITVEAG